MGKLIIFLKISTVTYLQLGLYTKKCKMILSYKYILCIPGDQAIHTIVKQFPLFPPPVQAILFNLFHTDDRWLHGFRKYKIQITEWEFYNTGFRKNIIKRIVDKIKQVFKLLSCSLWYLYICLSCFVATGKARRAPNLDNWGSWFGP